MLRLLALLCFCAFPALAQPNFVLILVDDFSLNLMPRRNTIPDDMPNLDAMQTAGMTLQNYFVSESLCCPSRATIFTGMLPHNTGVMANEPPEGGLAVFDANGLAGKTFAVALQAGEYKTGFMGKYLNGYNSATTPVPPGWNEWLSTGSGYGGFGYKMNHNGVISYPPDHITDVIAREGVAWIAAQTGPFFLELAPFSPHWPHTPPGRYADAFPGVTYPATPAYDARPDVNAPAWLQAIPPLDAATITTMTDNYRKRVQSMKAVDDMIGAIRAQLVAQGIANNTYLIFTSDNGYHMGEYSLRGGKSTPFDTDIKVPFVVVGPGIPPDSHRWGMTMSADIYPTLLELAGLPPSPTVDGRSLAPLFAGGIIYRTMAVVEYLRAGMSPSDPDYIMSRSGDPPSYTAIRAKTWMYVEYATGEVGYYDMTTDPDQLRNIVATITPARLAELHASLVANATCVGAAQCWAAQMR